MEERRVCLDTSVLIEYFRKVKKERSFFYKLVGLNNGFAVSIITVFEILIGSSDTQKHFWEKVFETVEVLPFDDQVSGIAVEIFKDLKPKGQLIEIPDLFIGATAKAYGYKLATLNQKHFSRIEGLELITEDSF